MMKIYISLMKILLLLSMFLAPLKALGKGFPNLYMVLALSSPLFIVMIIIYCLLKRRMRVNNIGQIIVYLIAILLWTIIGINNGYSVASEMASLMLLILFFIAISISYQENLISVEFIRKISYLLMYCWSGFYALVALGIILNIIPNSILVQMIAIWLEANPSTTMDSGFLGMIPRMGAGENILPLIIYAFYLFDKKAGSVLVWLMMFMYVLLDYGRLDMLFFSFLTIVFIYFKFIHGKITFKKYIIMLGTFFAIVVFSYFFFAMNGIDMDMFVTGWIERYGRESTERYLQVKYLTEYTGCSMWIGYGLGGYTPEYIRSDAVWVYEMQFHAFLMQMGIIGFIAIVMNYLIFLLRMIFSDIDKRYIFITLVCLAYWLLDSSLQGGVFYGVGRMVIIVIYMLTRKEATKEKIKGDSVSEV